MKVLGNRWDFLRVLHLRLSLLGRFNRNGSLATATELRVRALRLVFELSNLVLLYVNVAGWVILDSLLPLPFFWRLKHVSSLVRVYVVVLVVVKGPANHIASHELLHYNGRLRFHWLLGRLVLTRHDQQQFVNEKSEALSELLLANIFNFPLLQLPGHSDHAFNPVLVGFLGVCCLEVHVSVRL